MFGNACADKLADRAAWIAQVDHPEIQEVKDLRDRDHERMVANRIAKWRDRLRNDQKNHYSLEAKFDIIFNFN